jgi:hypothetical protein
MSTNNPLKNRKPIRRQGSERYLEITLLSFAVSVSATRLFLDLTGYPKIGNGDLHIAHVLWGGLLLFIANLMMLIYANRWVYLLGSMISGIGVGLFIDEVGKFITQNNDYFYPTAAPIIYAFFLLTFLVFIILRKSDRKKPDARTLLYYVLEDLSEVLDHDLSEEEKNIIIKRLDVVMSQSPQEDTKNLAESIKTFIINNRPNLVEEVPHLWEKTWNKFREFERKWITRIKLKTMIVVGLLFLGARMIFYPILVISFIRNPTELSRIIMGLINERLVNSASGLTWYQARMGLEGSLGLVLLISALLIIFRKEKTGMLLGYLALIFSLTLVNLVVFYFNQFSTITIAFVQFIVLLLIQRYRDRFVKI